MSARERATERWGDPEAEPELLDMLRESGALPQLSEGTLAAVADELCDIFGIDKGPLLVRLGALRERALSLQRRKEASKRPTSDSAVELLDSLSGCALSVRQLAQDLGRTPNAVQQQLQNMRAEGLVERSLSDGVYTYQITARGRRALRAGGDRG